MVPERPTLHALTILVATLALSGCLSDGTATDGELAYTGPAIDEPLVPVPVAWEGTLRAQGCYEGGVDTCDAQLKSEGHVEWFEVELDALPVAGELRVDWEARQSPDTGFYLRLECWDRAIPQCAPDGPDLARADGQEGPLSISVEDLSFLEEDTSLYVAFGVPARDTPAGDHHPAVDADFVIEGAFLVPGGGA